MAPSGEAAAGRTSKRAAAAAGIVLLTLASAQFLTAGSQSPADQLAKLADLRDRGVITAEEFDREKAKILA